jgi:hypothetical protein
VHLRRQAAIFLVAELLGAFAAAFLFRWLFETRVRLTGQKSVDRGQICTCAHSAPGRTSVTLLCLPGGWLMLGLGVFFTLLVGFGLVALVFYSSRAGFHEPPELVQKKKHGPSGRDGTEAQ